MQSGKGSIISELNHAHELAMELRESLDPSKIQICRALANQLICSMEKVICTAKASLAAAAEVEFSDGRELQVERFNQQFIVKEQKISKRRKTLANRTSQVSVSAEAGTEVPPDDGYSWRKYGQKDILGAKHPRSYYRCTHRKTQECSAMKQVQKSDENPSVFDITYLGTHTCFTSHHPQQRLHDQQNSLVMHLDFKTNLKIRSGSSDIKNQDPISSFSFPSTPIEGMNAENALFCSSQSLECGYGGILSSELMSPTTYGSNCFSWPTCDVNSQAESGLTEILSAANSVTDLSVLDADFMLENGELDAGIPFDTSIFFV